jgi:SulP family sulfate permease
MGLDLDAFTPKIVTVLREGYGPGQLRTDALAGLTVAIIALPLAMALAIASGASPDKGLITAIVAGLLISALGGSRVQIGGPTGAFVVVVFNVIAEHGYDGLVLATAMAGLILIAAGLARLGRIIRYIPHPVVTGFTAGIAVIIATSQIADFLGLSLAKMPADFIDKWRAYLGSAAGIRPEAVAVGLGCLLLIAGLRRWAPRLPSFLIALIAASLAAATLNLGVETVGSRFPGLEVGLQVPQLPPFTLAKLEAVVPAAFTIAFLAGIEALLSCVVADGMTGFRHRSNQELIGQGAANLASALFGGLPATGAIARTAANIKSGGRTPFAGIFHALFLLLFVLFAGELMTHVPMAALAAVLLVVAWGMSEAKRFLLILRMPVGERAVLVVTFALTVMVDLTVAIGVGVTMASLLFMTRMSESVAVTSDGDVPGGDDASQRDQLPEGVEVFRIDGPFFFGVAGELLDALKRIGRKPHTIILRLEAVPFLDASGALALEEFFDHAGGSGIRIILTGLQPSVSGLLHRIVGESGRLRPLEAADYGTALRMAARRPAA